MGFTNNKDGVWFDPSDGSIWDRFHNLTDQYRFPTKIFEVSVKRNKLQQSDEWTSDFQKEISLIDFFDQSALDLGQIKEEIKALDNYDGMIIKMPTKYDSMKIELECIKRSWGLPRGYYMKNDELYVQTLFLNDDIDPNDPEICIMTFKEKHMDLLSNFFSSIPSAKQVEYLANIQLAYIDDRKRVLDLEKEKELALGFPSYINRQIFYQGFLFIHQRIKEIAQRYLNIEYVGTMKHEQLQ